MKAPDSRGKIAGFTIVLALFAIACGLMQQPTPIVLPTPSATPEIAAELQTSATDAPATATPPTPTATTTTAAVALPTATFAPPTAVLATATATPQIPVGNRVLFDAGATDTVITGQLTGATTRTYVLGIAAGQLIDISAPTAQHLKVAISGVDGTLLKPEGEPFFRGVVPSSQDYLVTLTAGNATETYALNIIIPVRITFDPGATTTQLEATIPANRTRHYVIRALGDQTMTFNTTTGQGQIIAIVYGADGAVLQTDHAGAPDFSGTLPSSQDYLINLRAVGGVPASVTIDLTIPPPP